MASSYKLTYFAVKGIAEPIRFLLSYRGVDFEDVRMDRDNWPNIKPTMPFGQVPVLEVDGKKLHQSVAICRYLAKQAKITGANDWEDLEIDAIIDSINDFKSKLVAYFYETDPAIKESRKAPLFTETVPYYFERFEAIAKCNKGHLAVGRLTWADLYFVAFLDCLNYMAGQNLIADCPNLQEIQKRVLDIPSIKMWVEKRPKNEPY